MTGNDEPPILPQRNPFVGPPALPEPQIYYRTNAAILTDLIAALTSLDPPESV
ncbi:hypothetical protein [Nocardia salmonicida]|uniref:hypothetical protein n=1 Tax=Nocardia salmonicida TaxID=53431 RepID=UPI002E2D62C4|nr:hypothetical protein [Nocardia salmonicida]